MSRSNFDIVRHLKGQNDELEFMTKSQEEKVLKITIKESKFSESDDEDSDDELNKAVIYDSDDETIKDIEKWCILRKLNNLSPRSKKILELKKILMDFKMKYQYYYQFK